MVLRAPLPKLPEDCDARAKVRLDETCQRRRVEWLTFAIWAATGGVVRSSSSSRSATSRSSSRGTTDA